MNIFVCYARVDKPFASDFVRIVDNHDVFHDERVKPGEDWWEIIKLRLIWCDVFIILITPESMNSEYCRREFTIARQLKKEIYPVLFKAEAEALVWKELKGIQWVEMTGAVDDAQRNRINADLYEIEQRIQGKKPGRVPATVVDARPPYTTIEEPSDLIGFASKAMVKADFELAGDALARARKTAQGTTLVIVEEMEAQNNYLMNQKLMRNQCDSDYRSLYQLAQHPFRGQREITIKAFMDFQSRYPDYDPANIRLMLFGNQKVAAPSVVPQIAPALQSAVAARHGKTGTLPVIKAFRMDLLTFMPVHTPSTMAPFEMALYPVTNNQFEMFLQDPKGSVSARWWSYSVHAQNYHQKNPLQSVTGDPLLPRTMVSWYDAVAFCNWLGERLQRHIQLPTWRQRVRAAQGTDGLEYPAGSVFDPSVYNFRESGIRRPLPVNSFPDGASPFGVQDMSGNTWEWCLNAVDVDKTQMLNTAIAARRILMGGCYMSSREQLRTNYAFPQRADAIWQTIGFRVIARL